MSAAIEGKETIDEFPLSEEEKIGQCFSYQNYINM